VEEFFWTASCKEIQSPTASRPTASTRHPEAACTYSFQQRINQSPTPGAARAPELRWFGVLGSSQSKGSSERRHLTGFHGSPMILFTAATTETNVRFREKAIPRALHVRQPPTNPAVESSRCRRFMACRLLPVPSSPAVSARSLIRELSERCAMVHFAAEPTPPPTGHIGRRIESSP